jgi:hypothetical protein
MPSPIYTYHHLKFPCFLHPSFEPYVLVRASTGVVGHRSWYRRALALISFPTSHASSFPIIEDRLMPMRRLNHRICRIEVFGLSAYYLQFFVSSRITYRYLFQNPSPLVL